MCSSDLKYNNDDYQQNPQANAAQPANDNLPAETAEGYQVPRGAACILGGAQASSSNRHFKQLAREIATALPGVEASWPLKWSQYPIVFDSSDHPKSTLTVGTIPLVCTPTINNIAVSKTLIDGVEASTSSLSRPSRSFRCPTSGSCPPGPLQG